MTSEAWQDVRQELDHWAERGLRARFWIRDDDACDVTSQLKRLQALAERHKIDIGLAVIPGEIQTALIHALRDLKSPFVPMCHGWKHVNHGTTEQPGEFGANRPLSALCTDATMAYKVFSEHFGESNVVFVPPWARLHSGLLKHLIGIGFSAISTGPSTLENYAFRMNAWLPAIRIPERPVIRRLDVHVDVIDWNRRTARDARSIAAELVAQLRFRRRGFLPSRRPVGLLAHHLAHDEQIWELSDELLTALRSHESVDF